MTNSTHKTTYRNDYTPTDYLINSVDLNFELGEEWTTVTSRMAIDRRVVAASNRIPLQLDGKRLVLKEIRLDGLPLDSGEYSVTDSLLTIFSPPSAPFELELTTLIQPQKNTALEGLYRSSGMFCTQCEPEGFRAITYYLDRPDVMTLFTTTIVADRQRYPVLLSNGNLIDTGQMPDGRHFATWKDPFRKPSYLFALVAGDLCSLEDTYTTSSGRRVALKIYVHEQNSGKCDHAMLSLKNAMRWDEETFGREYDLDIYMIVAVDDFNMGAMENKGLNVFNSCYVLATPESATDEDYKAIEAVIGHEYFHNWSGNRVTCRDWFQLSLKEGLTVFRDQEFSSDMQSRGVKRIEDVRNLRAAQFVEDSGPLAHPVRPDSYMEINNFYTFTVYNKGAELVRMQHTLLGAEKFRNGMDLYFARFDGQAVTVDDFVTAMSEAGGVDLNHFSLWYSQAGTPQLQATGEYDPAGESFTLHLSQSCKPTPGQPEKKPFFIPISVALLDSFGRPFAIELDGDPSLPADSKLIKLDKSSSSFTFKNIRQRPTPALLRSFTAPVKLDYPYTHDQLALLMAHESDPFCRWEAGQTMAARVIMKLVEDLKEQRQLLLDEIFADSFRRTISAGHEDAAFLSETLLLPAEKHIAELLERFDPGAIHTARQFLIRSLAERCKDELIELRQRNRDESRRYAPNDGRGGNRRLANTSLTYLASLGSAEGIALCVEQYRGADNMTDAIAALTPLASIDCPERKTLLSDFYSRWQGERLVVDKWFSLQAASTLPGVLQELHALLEHPAFELTNPNRFRSLVAAFSQRNQVRFHDPSGSGYRFLADQLLRLIPVNPQVSARLLAPLSVWRRLEPGRSALMREQLKRINSFPELPRDVYEVVTKSLAGEG